MLLIIFENNEDMSECSFIIVFSEHLTKDDKMSYWRIIFMLKRVVYNGLIDYSKQRRG